MELIVEVMMVVVSGVVARGDFRLFKKNFVPEFSSKSTNFWGWKFPIFQEFGGKIEISSTDDFLLEICGRLSKDCNFLPRLLFDLRRRCITDCNVYVAVIIAKIALALQ